MGVTFDDFLKRLNGVISTPEPLISQKDSTELCDQADTNGLPAQYLYHHMVHPDYRVFHDKEGEEGAIAAGEGFVLRQKGRVVCFNFSIEEKLLACHPSSAEKEREVSPTPLRWEKEARLVCEEKMKSWFFLRQDLSANDAVKLILENLNSVSLVEALLPKALPFRASLDENTRRVHQLLANILEQDKISPDLKRLYGFYIRRRIAFYLTHREDININDKTFYQSAFNRMLNDFDLFTESYATTFSREFYGVLSWKALGSLLIGFGSHYALYPGIKKRIHLREEPLLPQASKVTKRVARYWTTLASVAVTLISYFASSLVTSFFKRKNTKDQTLPSCFPPYCPVINVKTDK